MRSVRGIATVCLLLAGVAARAGDDHWGYAYRNLEATAEASPSYTVNLVRYTARLDALLVQVLGVRTDYRMPTRFFVLPAADVRTLGKGDYEYVYKVREHENDVLITAGSIPPHRHYYGAFFGYTASLLASDHALGGPDWYMVGVPSVFADTVFEKGKAKLGNITGGLAYTLLTGGTLYPMRRFLAMTRDDARREGNHQEELWDAEAWYLARLVFVEGRHRSEFYHYLQLLREGHGEPEAFGASFRFSYEDLDREIATSMHERAHVYILDMPPDSGPSDSGAQALPEAEWQGRRALSYVYFGFPEQAALIATGALKLQADNASALRALARAQVEQHLYAEALATADRIPDASLDDCLDRGRVYAALASAGARLADDDRQLQAKARASYQRALSLDPGNRAAQAAMQSLGSG